MFIIFDELSDKRQQGKITYPMKVICVTRLFSLLCGITSMTNKFNNELTIKNLSKISNTNLDELCKIQKYIVNALIRSKMFDKFRYQGKFQLLIDGTGLVTFNYKHCEHCIVKCHSDGQKLMNTMF